MKQHVEAIARGNAAGALALYAEDAVIDGGGLCAVAPCVGKAAIQKELERRVAYPTESQNPDGAEALRAYLENELQPAFSELGFSTKVIELPTGKSPFLLAEYRRREYGRREHRRAEHRRREHRRAEYGR